MFPLSPSDGERGRGERFPPRFKGPAEGPRDLADYRRLGLFIGCEVPGMLDVDLQIRNLSLKTIPKP
jgi:hypothetical protein